MRPFVLSPAPQKGRKEGREGGREEEKEMKLF
jgi:hypothetical protein